MKMRNGQISQFSFVNSQVHSHFSILKSIGHWALDISD